MIDLSGAKVGDKFLLRGGQAAQIIAINETQVVLGNDEGFYLNARGNGRSVEFDEFDIVSKVDPRPWLKDMPDAGIFADNVNSLHMSKSGCWFYKRKGVDYNYDICGALKMPTLTGDQWEDSLISIDELREWQLNNK